MAEKKTAGAADAKRAKVTLKKELPGPLVIAGVEMKGGEEVEVTPSQARRLHDAGFLRQ